MEKWYTGRSDSGQGSDGFRICMQSQVSTPSLSAAREEELTDGETVRIHPW